MRAYRASHVPFAADEAHGPVHIEDLRRDAARATLRREARASSTYPNEAADAAITIRLALPEDSRALARLAGLDCARVPAGTVLIAETNGQIRAALSLRDRATIADPFHPTVALVQLLVARAAQLRDEPRRRRVFWRTPATAPLGSSRWRASMSRSD